MKVLPQCSLSSSMLKQMINDTSEENNVSPAHKGKHMAVGTHIESTVWRTTVCLAQTQYSNSMKQLFYFTYTV